MLAVLLERGGSDAFGSPSQRAVFRPGTKVNVSRSPRFSSHSRGRGRFQPRAGAVVSLPELWTSRSCGVFQPST